MNRDHIQRILVATDLAADAVGVVKYAAARAREWHAELVLLHVLPFDAEARQADVVRTQLRTLADALAGKDTVTRVVVSSGELPREILREADEWDADLVMLAAHHRVGLLRLLQPSVAWRVARSARCPVLLVHPYLDGCLEELT